MHLYLVQHGEAVAKEVDPMRPLTKSGGADVDKIANFLGGSIYPREIWHSGKLRARQTAERLAEHTGGKAIEQSNLDPDNDIGHVASLLEKIDHDLTIVGHLPYLSRLASSLLVSNPDRETIAFAQGGVVALTRQDDRSWRVSWMVVPSLLR